MDKSLDVLCKYLQLFPKTIIEKKLHFVEEGNLITSAGISAGIDMALKVVSRTFGEEVAKATARHMEYPPSRKAMPAVFLWPDIGLHSVLLHSI